MRIYTDENKWKNHILSFLLAEARGLYLSVHGGEARGSALIQESGGVELILQNGRVSFRVLGLEVEVGAFSLPREQGVGVPMVDGIYATDSTDFEVGFVTNFLEVAASTIRSGLDRREVGSAVASDIHDGDRIIVVTRFQQHRRETVVGSRIVSATVLEEFASSGDSSEERMEPDVVLLTCESTEVIISSVVDRRHVWRRQSIGVAV